ncbi:hypothetical protein ABTN46_19525, partial [Acinetobacter baumannii]
ELLSLAMDMPAGVKGATGLAIIGVRSRQILPSQMLCDRSCFTADAFSELLMIEQCAVSWIKRSGCHRLWCRRLFGLAPADPVAHRLG